MRHIKDNNGMKMIMFYNGMKMRHELLMCSEVELLCSLNIRVDSELLIFHLRLLLHLCKAVWFSGDNITERETIKCDGFRGTKLKLFLLPNYKYRNHISRRT